MTPYQKGGRGVFYARVSLPDGRERTVSLGTYDRQTANDVEAFAQRMKSRRRWDVLTAIVEDRGKLPDAYDADVRGELDQWVKRLNDPDLDQWLTTWEREGANAKYVKQCRRLIARGKRFPASEFRKGRISAFLAKLPVDNPTKNRYRSALSCFATFLVEREVLEFHPIRAGAVAMYPENDPRINWMTWEQAQRVCESVPQPYRGLYALLYGTGMEISAALRLRVLDMDYEARTAHARGSKTKWRNRVVRVEDWAWGFVCDVGSTDLSPLFPGITYDDAYRTHRDAVEALGLAGYTLHDARHTYAVNALKKGYDEQVVAHQLGHRVATLVRKNYGRYVPSAEDYESPKRARNKAGSATDSATRMKGAR